MKLSAIICLVLMMMSIGAANADRPVANQCKTLDSWYLFSQQAFCFPKSKVIKLTHLNQSEPSASVVLQPNESSSSIELGVFWEPENGAIGRLSQHFGLSVDELFVRLEGADFSEEEQSLVSKVLWLDASEKIDVQEIAETSVLTIVRSGGAHSSVYIHNPSWQGLIYLAGELSEDQAEWVVRHIDFSQGS